MVTFTTVSSESEIAKLLIAKWASVEDRAEAKLLQRDVRRQEFLLARATLRALLFRVTGTGEWRIYPDDKGKPSAFTATGIAGPHISISHTHGLVACAVSKEGPLGVDVEHWRVRDFMAIAGYVFGPCECKEVARNGISAFYRIWTLREAISKATGVGLIASIDGCDNVADVPESGYWITKGWRLFYFSPQTNYSLALASKGEGIWSEASLTLTDAATII